VDVRKPIIAGNWKMNCIIDEALVLANEINRAFVDENSCDVVLCPPFTALLEVSEVLTDSNVSLGAQNMHWEAQGAYTGETSAPMLIDTGCKYVIIGHSERRQFFAETNATVNKKIKAAMQNKLIPIVCVGETLAERESNKTFNVIKEQVLGAFAGISNIDASNVVLAYEPVWAIGTGKNATSKQAEEVHLFIRNLMAELYGREIADSIRIQYGGSVKAENVEELMKEKDIDGALVGGASLKANSFIEIIRKSIKAKKSA